MAQAPQTALVGRDRELSLLVDALARARSEQTVQLVTLVGVPGMGKSRLVFELLETVEASPELTIWRQGRCLPYGEGVALWALGEVVKAQAGILESDPAEEATTKLERTVADLIADESEAVWMVGQLRPLVGCCIRTSCPATARERRSRPGDASWKRWPSRTPRCW